MIRQNINKEGFNNTYFQVIIPTYFIMRDNYHKQWIQTPQNLNLSVPYIKATVLRPLNNGDLECQLQTDRGVVQLSVPLNQSFELTEETDYSDMCKMNVLNEPEVLSNIIRRYKKDEIFTSIGPTLIVVNPYRKIQRLFNQQILSRISQQINFNKLEKDQPHIFMVAGKAFLSLKEADSKQAIVISGQSGAGKTESTKYCMQLLTSLSQKKNHSIQQKILACNPLLQAFGNSKTVRNENSSRFGKYVKIYFSTQNTIKGASIYSYLLQKSRVVSLSPNQRSFHSFYALTASGKYDTRQSSYYTFLRQSGCYNSSYIDDKKYFEDINSAFKEIGFSAIQIDQIWILISSILKLGNIEFDETNHKLDESKPCELTNSKYLNKISQSLKIQNKHLLKMLLYEKKKFLKEYTLSAYNKEGCQANRNTLCKALYNSVFQSILSKIEIILKPQTPSLFRQINILDIFGFQNFQNNSFEQFCINFTNQKLLKLYNIYVFDREMEILKEDGLEKQILGILPPTNNQIINIINGKLSLVSLINDMTLPQFKDEDIIQSFHRLETPYLSFDKLNKNKFCLIHTQCPVNYTITSFKTKNQDKINDQILDVITNLFISNTREQFGKTILSKFTKQIDDLITELNSSTVHFIRCIKPNQFKEPYNPDQRYILTQIRYLGIFQTIMIRKNIFPFRKSYNQFYRQFKLLFPLFKKQKNEKSVTQKILKELTKKQSDYLLGNHRVYISTELQQILNNQIFKYLKLRNQKIRKIQIGLRRCLYRKKILYYLHLLVQRKNIWRTFPFKLENKAKRSAFQRVKYYCMKLKQKEIREWEEKQLMMLREAKRIRQEQLLRHQTEKSKQQMTIIPQFIHKLYIFIQRRVYDSFHLLYEFNNQSQTFLSKTEGLSVNTKEDGLSIIINRINETAFVNNSVIDSHAPYLKLQTPSSDLIGKQITFNRQFLDGMKKSSSTKTVQNSNVIFPECLQIQPVQFCENKYLERLQNILSEQYKVHFQGSEEDFYSPFSENCHFKLEDLSQQKLNDIIDFPSENYFNKILRKRTTFLGSKKSFQEILVFKKGVLNKSMTLLSNQQEQKKCLNIFKTILKIGNQIQIQSVLAHVEKFVEQCQNSSMEMKRQVMIQLMRQANTSEELTAIRIYQTMSVFLHVYNIEEDLMKACLNLLYWKLQQKSTKTSQNQYIRYIFGTLLRKIDKRTIIGYLPINYQIMGLMCRRQISIPVYLPTGNSILVKVQAYNNFSQIKQKCLHQFGINLKRFKSEMFTFFEVINFDNEQLQQTPIKQTNMVWDMMTYWQLTKNKYLQSEIKPPNFFLMLKIRYAFQLYPNDEEGIELCFSQNYFDYFMGKIILEDKSMFYLAAILHQIKYSGQDLKQIVLALLPIWVTKKMKKQEAIYQLKNFVLDIKSQQITPLQAKYKFVHICSKSPLSMTMTIPTEGQLKLFLKTRSLCILKYQSDKVQIIPLRNLVKWSIQKQSFIFQILSKDQDQQNRVIKIQTDSASVCNQFLKCISQFKAKSTQVPNFKKK